MDRVMRDERQPVVKPKETEKTLPRTPPLKIQDKDRGATYLRMGLLGEVGDLLSLRYVCCVRAETRVGLLGCMKYGILGQSIGL